MPENDYVHLVRYMIHHHGSGGLPCATYRETAELLSLEVGWIVDPACLKTAVFRYKKRRKS